MESSESSCEAGAWWNLGLLFQKTQRFQTLGRFRRGWNLCGITESEMEFQVSIGFQPCCNGRTGFLFKESRVTFSEVPRGLPLAATSLFYFAPFPHAAQWCTRFM